MVKCSIKQESNGFTVVVHNEKTGYRLVGETYEPKRGPFGTSPAEFEAARQRAIADAKDWTAKFRQAGIKAETVEVVS